MDIFFFCCKKEPLIKDENKSGSSYLKGSSYKRIPIGGDSNRRDSDFPSPMPIEELKKKN